MIRIEYPYNIINSIITKANFNELYYQKIKKFINGKESALDDFLIKINYKELLNLKKILTADFLEIVEIKNLIDSSIHKIDISNFFLIDKKSVYENSQGDISSFFMNNKFNLKTCHYCNIDFINYFNDIGEYENIEELLNKGTEEEINIIVSNGKAKLIYEYLKNKDLKNVDELLAIKGIGKITINLIKSIDIGSLIKNKNHFTLDHFITKQHTPFFSLSLYNLIPACYSCNCKFKGSTNYKKFEHFSPSSDDFKLNDILEFRLLYDVRGRNMPSTIKKINNLNRFKVEIIANGKYDEFDNYLDMFKLKGRYIFHKNEAFKMIDKRKLYSDSQIKELSQFFIKKRIYKDEDSIKKDIFGTILFNDDEANHALSKYKRDIAKQLGIIK